MGAVPYKWPRKTRTSGELTPACLRIWSVHPNSLNQLIPAFDSYHFISNIRKTIPHSFWKTVSMFIAFSWCKTTMWAHETPSNIILIFHSHESPLQYLNRVLMGTRFLRAGAVFPSGNAAPPRSINGFLRARAILPFGDAPRAYSIVRIITPHTRHQGGLPM